MSDVEELSIASIPVDYAPSALPEPARLMDELWTGLDWERRGATPRREYYVDPLGRPYAYGRGEGRRVYEPRASAPAIDAIWRAAEERAGCRFDVCFLNGYEDGSDQLGWHSDDSVEMDPARPIAVASLGAEREIWFRPISRRDARARLALEAGSLCVMRPGMQTDFYHRIPKASRPCGPRVSLTFRGWTPGK